MLRGALLNAAPWSMIKQRFENLKPAAFEDLIYSNYRIFKSARVLLCCFNFLFHIDLNGMKAAHFKLYDEF
jgi:hypothetical protein